MSKSIDGLPIIMLSMSRWDGLFSSASISLAKEFAKTNLVFYLDNPFTFKDIFRNHNRPEILRRKPALYWGKSIYTSIEASLPNLIAVTPRAVAPINWLPSGKLYESLSILNNKVVIEVIRKIKKDYHLEDYILFNSFNPFYGHHLPKDIKPYRQVYQSRDDISQSQYVDKHGVDLEIKAIEHSDLAMATSLGLVKKLNKKSSKTINYLPNAADIEIFRYRKSEPKEIPGELRNINKKIIGYTGNICHRINYELVRDIAIRHTDKLLLFVGPRNDAKATDIRLDEFPNILFVGPKPINVLPDYLALIDCAIIPFKCNELTRSIYPLKINEYLAAGKAVVSTNFSEDVSGFSDVVLLSDSSEEFLMNIDRALNEDSEELKEKRVVVAENNTWKSRVRLFWQLLNEESNKSN